MLVVYNMELLLRLASRPHVYHESSPAKSTLLNIGPSPASRYASEKAKSRVEKDAVNGRPNNESMSRIQYTTLNPPRRLNVPDK